MTAKKKLLRSKPHNPLEPEYKAPDENGEYQTIGNVAGSKVPVKYFKKNMNEADSALRTHDIERSKPGSRQIGAFHTIQRRQVRPLIESADIAGA